MILDKFFKNIVIAFIGGKTSIALSFGQEMYEINVTF